MIFFLPCRTWYSGAKSFSMSTPSLLFGRSMTWPTDAFTWKSLPRYFSSVRALAGDSTMTRFFAMPYSLAGTASNVNRQQRRSACRAVAARCPSAPARARICSTAAGGQPLRVMIVSMCSGLVTHAGHDRASSRDRAPPAPPARRAAEQLRRDLLDDVLGALRQLGARRGSSDACRACARRRRRARQTPRAPARRRSMAVISEPLFSAASTTPSPAPNR